MTDHNIAAVVNYTGAAVTGALWGLSISDFSMIISTAMAVCGLLLQVYLAFRKRR